MLPLLEDYRNFFEVPRFMKVTIQSHMLLDSIFKVHLVFSPLAFLRRICMRISFILTFLAGPEEFSQSIIPM